MNDILASEHKLENYIRVLMMVWSSFKSDELVHYLNGLNGINETVICELSANWKQMCQQIIKICNSALRQNSTMVRYLSGNLNLSLLSFL